MRTFKRQPIKRLPGTTHTVAAPPQAAGPDHRRVYTKYRVVRLYGKQSYSIERNDRGPATGMVDVAYVGALLECRGWIDCKKECDREEMARRLDTMSRPGSN